AAGVTGKLDEGSRRSRDVNLANPALQPPAAGQHRGATPQEIAAAQARVDASDRRFAHSPAFVRTAAHRQAVLASFPPPGTAVLPSGASKTILDALSSLPREDQARVFESLPGVDPQVRRAVQQLSGFAHPSGISGLANNFARDALSTPQGI